MLLRSIILKHALIPYHTILICHELNNELIRCDLEWRAAHENQPLLIRVMMFISVTRWPDTLFPLKLFLQNPKSEVKVDKAPMHPVKSSALG